MYGPPTGDKMELVDQISELPEFILHIILSFLDAKEACRAGVLSKKWHTVWSSMPVLDFQPQYFKKGGSVDFGKFSQCSYDSETVLSYTIFINTTMSRYSMQKHGIRKLSVEFPMVQEYMKPVIDKWIEIAVRNKVEELEICILVEESLDYKLPEFLFSARSLKVLKCTKVQLPFYPTMKLFCLEKLILTRTVIDDYIQFRGCSDLKNISVPWIKRSLEDDEVAKDIKTFALENFFYLNHFQCPWPWNMNMTALKNLRKLQISSADITDDIVSELAAGLSVLETLYLSTCLLLKCVKISSISLKGFSIVGCHRLKKLTIDSPNLGILKDKVRRWKDPLKGIEVEVIKNSRLLSYSSEVEIRLRLSW